MAEGTIKMVTDAIDAFVRKDLELARSVIVHDDAIDALYTAVRNDLLVLIRADVKNSEQVFDLMQIAKYYERIGDHAENIAEWVIFYITGVHKDMRIL